MWQASRETPWHAGVRLHTSRRTRGLLFKIGLALLGLVVSQRLDRRWHRTPAILGERFARQDDVVLPPLDWRAWAAITRRAAIVKAARITFTLRRSVLRGRQISSAWAAVTSAAIAITASATPASPASSPPASAIPAAIATAVLTRAAIVSDARRIIPCGVVGGRKILGSRGIGIRLALLRFGNFRVPAGFFAARRINCVARFHRVIRLVAVILLATRSLLVASAVFRFFVEVHLFVHPYRRQRFPRQNFDGRFSLSRQRGRGRISVSLTVIIILEVFENVADIQEGVAIQANIHECRLHARQNARDFSLIDAADERELFLTRNVDLD